MWPCTLKLDEEKWKHVGLARQKGFWPSICAQVAEAGTRQSKLVHLPERTVINVVWLLLPVSIWLLYCIQNSEIVYIPSASVGGDALREFVQTFLNHSPNAFWCCFFSPQKRRSHSTKSHRLPQSFGMRNLCCSDQVHEVFRYPKCLPLQTPIDGPSQTHWIFFVPYQKYHPYI